MKNHLYLGAKGHVGFPIKRTGKEPWKSHLKSNGLANLVILKMTLLSPIPEKSCLL